MPNNARTQIDAVWIDGYTPPASDWEDLERKIFGSWNGTRGGAYAAPAGASGSAYVIAGSGLAVTGPTRLSYGGTIYGGSGAFVIGDSAWPELVLGHAGRTRSIMQPIEGFQTTKRYLWSRIHPYAGVGSVALACRLSTSRTIETADLYIPLRVIDGAVMTSVTLHYRVAKRRSYAPIAMPKMRVLRVPRDSGNTNQTVLPEPLMDTTDGLGFDFTALVTDPNTWYNEGDVQTFEYVCDQNNTIDVENYSYVVHLIEETGALSVEDEYDGIRYAERKIDCALVGLNTLTLNGDQLCDGTQTSGLPYRVLIVDTDAVLKTGEPDTAGLSSKNGLWVAGAGGVNWTRAADLSEQQDFTPGWIVKSSGGQINGGTGWQCAGPTTTQRVELIAAVTADANKTQPYIRPSEPQGNIYHALVPTFELTDLRFQ
jgi:hypothetical protein